MSDKKEDKKENNIYVAMGIPKDRHKHMDDIAKGIIRMIETDTPNSDTVKRIIELDEEVLNQTERTIMSFVIGLSIGRYYGRIYIQNDIARAAMTGLANISDKGENHETD